MSHELDTPGVVQRSFIESDASRVSVFCFWERAKEIIENPDSNEIQKIISVTGGANSGIVFYTLDAGYETERMLVLMTDVKADNKQYVLGKQILLERWYKGVLQGKQSAALVDAIGLEAGCEQEFTPELRGKLLSLMSPGRLGPEAWKKLAPVKIHDKTADILLRGWFE